ncbi:MAG TPA: hypothetical protein DGG95_15220 [Cytophagales bacterium]|jgi:type IX secretion system PorP/SprF family membrane protein|nr:hypothetical protein [Cytophagales bacterium]
MNKIWLAIPFFLVVSYCNSQNDPAFRQFYFNPFHFNPAYTGIDGHTDIYLSTRKQWIDFKDAPVVSQFSVQYATRSRVSLGFTVSDQEVVALRNTFISTAFAYKVPFTRNQSVTFALSGGVGTSNLDLSNFDYSTDPTILNAATTSVYGNAGFGAVYVWNRLKIGFALPQLFGQNYISPQKLGNKNFSQLQKQNYSASYKFSKGNFSFAPWFLFRLSDDNQNSWDGGAQILYREKIWLGSAYNSQQGPAFFFGMEIKETIKIGYSYELPPANNGFIQTKSMELQLRIRLNPKKSYPSLPDVSPLNLFTKSQEEIAEEQKQKMKLAEAEYQKKYRESITTRSDFKTDSIGKKNSAAENFKRDSIRRIATSNSDFPDGIPIAKRGFYLVAGSFKNPNYALRQQSKMVSKGLANAHVVFHRESGLYRVCLYYSTLLDEVKLQFDNLKRMGLFDCFILSVK